MNTHEVLVAARNLIDRRGHWQGGRPETAHGLCPVLAIRHCSDYEQDRSYAARQVFASAVGVSHGNDIPLWNDTSGRTKAEVLAAFDKAIAATAPPPADPFESFTVNRISFREPVAR